MSIELDHGAPDSTLGPELTALGKRIEMLRIDRGISKQYLARFAGTSRQQLWRVMTGKSDLTGALRERLADALRVDQGSLAGAFDPALAPAATRPELARGVARQDAPALALEQYLASADAITATLRAMPAGDAGRQLKRAHLDALEDLAVARRLALAEHVFALRRRVVNGEL
ncbi:MAG TPA: helix-turn-helix transcriptional regulator [Gemmatimonadaceae bacterium]|nr:helix-turn-helix transcriptional regulator [Gemmatimonadaceae bacterium]